MTCGIDVKEIFGAPSTAQTTPIGKRLLGLAGPQEICNDGAISRMWQFPVIVLTAFSIKNSIAVYTYTLPAAFGELTCEPV